MITSHIIGGLGNQMFQYALGKSRAAALNTHLSLDTSDFPEYGLHQGFELNRIFNLNVPTISTIELHTLIGWRNNKYVKKFINSPKFSKLRGSNYIVEPSIDYWSGILDAPDNSYLVGYWQSEKYFESIKHNIKTDFSFKTPLTLQNHEISKSIHSSNSVSIHVRRGDYVSNPKANSMHGLCTKDYYSAAIAYINSNAINPVYFIFSDDIPWVKANLELPVKSYFIDNNAGKDNYNDMHLMMLCKHNIIANSTFSWWGAWLNSNPDKMVISPKKWFSKNINSNDLIPETWIRL